MDCRVKRCASKPLTEIVIPPLSAHELLVTLAVLPRRLPPLELAMLALLPRRMPPPPCTTNTMLFSSATRVNSGYEGHCTSVVADGKPSSVSQSRPLLLRLPFQLHPMPPASIGDWHRAENVSTGQVPPSVLTLRVRQLPPSLFRRAEWRNARLLARPPPDSQQNASHIATETLNKTLTPNAPWRASSQTYPSPAEV